MQTDILFMNQKTKTTGGAKSADNVLWLGAPLLAIPFLAIGASLEAEGMANIVRSLSDSVLVLIPAICLAAAFLGHLTARKAAIAVGVAVVLDTAGLRHLMLEVTRGWLHDSHNPSWVTVALVLFAAAAVGGSLLHKATLSRVVCGMMCGAQIVVLTAFHQLLVISPIQAEEARETALVSGLVEQRGDFSSLCDVAGRACWVGSPEGVASEVKERVSHSEGIVRLLEDTLDRPVLLHSWTEMILPSTDAEGLMNVSILKTTQDRALVMVDIEGPSRVLDTAKQAFGVLAVAFHQAWITLGLLIIWRHRNLYYRGGRWRTEG